MTFPNRILAIGDDLATLAPIALPAAAISLARTDARAIALAHAEDPDVILLDIALSGADSIALCRQFKADEQLRAIPLLFLTTPQTERSLRMAALDAGAEGFLAMPPDEQELIAQIKTMSRLKAALRQQRLEQDRASVAAAECSQAWQQELRERLQMAESLRASEERWRTIVKALPDGIVIASMEGLIEQVSDQAWRMYGFAGPEEVLGRNLLEFLDPSCHQVALANIQAMLEGRYSGPAEYLVIKRDSTRFYAEINAEVLRDHTGAPAHLLFVERDVTSRKQADVALQASEERLRMAERVAQVGHYEIDIATGTAHWSEGICRILGLAPSSDPPTVADYAQLIHPDDRAHFLEHFARAIDQLEPFDLEYQILHASGDIRCVHGLASVMENGQGRRTMFGIVQDITARKRVEASLHDSEEEVRTLFDVASVGIVQIDPRNDQLLRFNNKYCEITGYSPEELPGVPLSELTHPDDRAHDWLIFGRAARGEIANYTNEKRYIRKDGSVIWVRLNAAFIRDAEGQPLRTVAVCEDITERKQAEAALLETENRYRRLLDMAPIGIAVHADGRVVFANPAAAQLLGADTPEQLAGKPISEIVHPDHWPALLERIPRLLDGEQGLYPVEDVYRRLDGTAVDVEVVVALLQYQGQPAVQVIMRDIGDRKRAEAERTRLLAQVQAQAQQTVQILDTVPQGVMLLDGGGRVLVANPIGMRDLVALAGAAVGDRLTLLGDLPLAELLASAPTGPWHELHAGQRTYEAIARPIRSTQPRLGAEPALEFWVVVIDDVTQSRSVSEQLQRQERLAAVGQLAAGIAHDFNNILAIIALQTSMAVQSPDLPAPLRGRLELIGAQTANAATLIQQILDFSRRAILERRPLDLAPLLEEQVNLLTHTLPEHIQISLTCEPGEFVVMADATRIQQMVMNLAVNARDAMPQGGKLHITLARQDVPPHPGLSADNWVCLTVADSGIGIDAEALAHIFEPFFTTKARGQGTGLGLAQVYGIVKQHAGEIDVRSAPGQGTAFTIYLPAVAVPAPVVSAPAVAPPEGNGATILLVEDNAILLDAMRDVVEMLGYKVISAQNGREALAVLEENRPAVALVLTDLIMPQMGGDALLAAMRGRGLATPVVILSGHPLEGELDSLKRHGLAGWLLKPPNLRELAQLLAQALAHPS